VYFVARNNRLYAWAVSILPIYRYLMLLLLIVLMLWGIYTERYNIVGPILRRYERNIDQLYGQQRDDIQIQQTLRDVATVTEKTQETLDTYMGGVRAAAPWQLPNILEAARRAGLSPEDCVVMREEDRDWHTKRAIRFSCVGSLKNLIGFFETVRTDGDLSIQCRSMSLTRASDQNYRATCSFDAIALQ